MQNKISTLLSIAILLLLTACHHSKQSIGSTADIISGSKTLYQFKWTATELQGQALSAADAHTAYLIFKTGTPNRITGSTGCNNLTGSFILSGSNTIKFSPLGTTRMACIENNNEAPFIDAIAQADNWNMVNNQLLLSNNNNKVVAKFIGSELSK